MPKDPLKISRKQFNRFRKMVHEKLDNDDKNETVQFMYAGAYRDTNNDIRHVEKWIVTFSTPIFTNSIVIIVEFFSSGYLIYIANATIKFEQDVNALIEVLKKPLKKPVTLT